MENDFRKQNEIKIHEPNYVVAKITSKMIVTNDQIINKKVLKQKVLVGYKSKSNVNI